MAKAGLKILIVDDFETVRLLFIKCLGELGYSTVHEADNGEDALRMIKAASDQKIPYDLIFCDWNMPLMNGLETLVTLRKWERKGESQTIPFVMVTANSDESAVIDAMREGVSEYLVKPFDAGSLQKTIERVLNRLTQHVA